MRKKDLIPNNIYYKRLEEGTFELPSGDGRLSWHQLVLMIEGVSVQKVRYRKRYTHPHARIHA